MNNLSTVGITDISSQIGALELGDHLQSTSDSALEASGANASLTPSQVSECQSSVKLRACIGDGALEAAAGTSFGPPPYTTACRSADIRQCM